MQCIEKIIPTFLICYMDLVWTMPLPLLYLWIVIILMDFGCIALYVWTLDMSYVLNGVFVIVLWSYIYVMHYKLSIYT